MALEEIKVAKCLLRVVVASFLLLILSSCSNEPLSFHKSDGTPFHFKDYKGKYIVLNYWSPLCEPCLHEIKALNAFYDEHKNKDAVVVAVDYDQPKRIALQKQIKDFGISYPAIVEDPARLLQLGSINYLPTTFILNSHGKVLTTLVGPQTKDMLDKALRSLKTLSA